MQDQIPEDSRTLVDATPARRPERVALDGRFVSLVPLGPEHAAALYEGSHGPGAGSLWAWMGDGPYGSANAFAEGIAAKAASADPFWAVLDAASRRPLGYLSLMRIEPAHRVIEVGNILYTPALQRTPGATEAVFLIASHVFERLGYRRLEWKCNALNAPSRRAALRFGFAFEGIFRQHMIIKGRNRDTAWYAMMDHDWTARRAAFRQWLAEDNFGPGGVQKVSLADLNGVAAG